MIYGRQLDTCVPTSSAFYNQLRHEMLIGVWTWNCQALMKLKFYRIRPYVHIGQLSISLAEPYLITLQQMGDDSHFRRIETLS